jgi:hypothetical protein
MAVELGKYVEMRLTIILGLMTPSMSFVLTSVVAKAR